MSNVPIRTRWNGTILEVITTALGNVVRLLSATGVVDFVKGIMLGGVAVAATAHDLNSTRPASKVRLLDDFLGDALDAGWGEAHGTDGQVVAPAINVAVDGHCRMVAGDDAAATMAVNGVQLHRALVWRVAGGGTVFETRLKIDDITTVCFFAGLTDQIAALEMPFTLGALDALTANADNAVGFLFDTEAATDVIFGVGAKATVGVKQASAVAPVNGTLIKLRVEVSAAGAATFYINDVAIGAALADAVTNSSMLTPCIAVFSRAAATRTLDVDYILVEKDRG